MHSVSMSKRLSSVFYRFLYTPGRVDISLCASLAHLQEAPVWTKGDWLVNVITLLSP